MKIKLIKSFEGLNLNDTEVVFAYVISYFIDTYGPDYEYTLHTLDAKTLLYGKVHNQALFINSFSDEIKKVLNIGMYSEYRVGFSLHRNIKERDFKFRNFKGKRVHSTQYTWYEIKQPNAMMLYSYLLGALTQMKNPFYEEESLIGHTKPQLDKAADEHLRWRDSGRLIESKQFNELLRVTRLD